MTLQALKPNGALHQTWQGERIAQTDNWLVTSTPLGTAVRHHTNDLTYVMQHSNLGIFSATEYYNVFIGFNPDQSFKHLYVNVAEPAIWDEDMVSWVDLELDIMLYPNKAPELLDEDEFEAAQASGLISAEQAKKVKALATWLIQESTSGRFPFLTVGYDEAVEKIKQAIEMSSQGARLG